VRQSVSRITLSKVDISSSHAVIGMVEGPLCRSSEEELVYFKDQDEGVDFFCEFLFPFSVCCEK